MIRGTEMLKHAHMPIAFVAILATILAGILQLNIWSIGVCASTLGLISLTASVGAFARYGQPGGAITLPVVFISTALNSSAASSAAYGLGRAIGWVWGL